MSAHNQGSGPRSNRYSESKLSNWAVYDPFWVEAKAALKQFDAKLALSPSRPKVITLPPAEGFVHPCTKLDVGSRLDSLPAQFLEGIRAVFLLSGTRKQLRTKSSRLGCYGMYGWQCIFLCAYPETWKPFDPTKLRDFYLDDVLVHEVGHHVDRHRFNNSKTKEGFAYWFAREFGKKRRS